MAETSLGLSVVSLKHNKLWHNILCLRHNILCLNYALRVKSRRLAFDEVGKDRAFDEVGVDRAETTEEEGA